MGFLICSVSFKSISQRYFQNGDFHDLPCPHVRGYPGILFTIIIKMTAKDIREIT